VRKEDSCAPASSAFTPMMEANRSRYRQAVTMLPL
jgi:hypothetical protein